MKIGARSARCPGNQPSGTPTDRWGAGADAAIARTRGDLGARGGGSRRPGARSGCVREGGGGEAGGLCPDSCGGCCAGWLKRPCYTCYGVMHVPTIPHRELRNNSAEILRRVQAGETFEITNNGRPVALLAPVPEEPLALLRRSGAVTRSVRVDFAALRRATGIASQDVLDDLRGEL